MLTHQYEIFKMKPDETITEMHTRFIHIINNLKSLEKTYSNGDMVRKLLRSLPISWKPKVTAIQEAKDLKTLPLEELVGSLLSYEIELQAYEEEDKKISRKSIALKSAMKDDSSDSESMDEEEFGLLSRRFKKFFRKKSSFEKKKPFKRDKKEIICYNCNKPGHIKPECPLNKNKDEKFKPKKKAFKATWDDSSESEDDSSDEEANLCFMANENEVNTKSLSSDEEDLDDIENLSYDELLEILEAMNHDLRKLVKKNKFSKKQVDVLHKEKAELK
jgi:hypothetical protein